MAREHEMSAQPWGTLEELLLACAVKRHGTKSWESIAMDLKNRTSAFHSITPQNCLDNFNHLKRRFDCQNDYDDDDLVDELKKSRIAELKGEIQQSDVKIMSLELKVKRMEEDRERSLKEEADLGRDGKGEKLLSPEFLAGKSADDNRSFNESNSTSQKGELMMKNNLLNDAEEENEEAKFKTEPVVKSEPDPVQTGLEPDRSCNGKLGEGNNNNNNNNNSNRNNNIVKKEKKMSELGGGGESKNELWESKQSSDVQSSASLSKTMKRRRRSGTISSGEEVSLSPATKKSVSEPLIKFLGILRSHRLGWFFERRQRSQETDRHKNLIRQHMDLKTIKSRLNEGAYDCIQKFYRDLLLLFNNAIIFYKQNSQEHLAAQELRAIVWKEMTDKLQKPPQPVTVKSEPEQQPVSLSKTNKSPTMVVCGKVSSIKAISENASKKGDKKERDVDKKPKVNEKKSEGSFVSDEEKGISKQRRKERSVSGRRNSRTSNKSGEIKHEYGGNELSSHDALEVKMDKRETMVQKRQGAASFLKRMKQNSPSEVVDNEDDVSEDESRDDKREKQKEGRGRKRDGRTDRVTRSSRGRGAREESGKAKRAVGRPPKRQEVPESTRKRRRDNGESEVGVGGSGRSRKRSRK